MLRANGVRWGRSVKMVPDLRCPETGGAYMNSFLGSYREIAMLLAQNNIDVVMSSECSIPVLAR